MRLALTTLLLILGIPVVTSRACAATASTSCVVSLKRLDEGSAIITTQRSTGYWVYVDPAQCGACGANASVRAVDVKAELGAGICTTNFQVTFVATNGDTVAPRPDPAHPLAPTQAFAFKPNCMNMCLKTFTLSPSIALDRPCFLHFAMISPSACGDYEPWVISASPYGCTPGRTFLSVPDGGPLQDVCLTNGTDAVLFVDATCDAVVPVRRGGWGALKVRYH